MMRKKLNPVVWKDYNRITWVSNYEQYIESEIYVWTHAQINIHTHVENRQNPPHWRKESIKPWELASVDLDGLRRQLTVTETQKWKGL